MPKSAQQKFNEYLEECRETQDAINELENASRENYGNYAYACGIFGALLNRTITELPKARREAFRQELLNLAQRQKNEHLAKVIKTSDQCKVCTQ
jgi:hypothetical protein